MRLVIRGHRCGPVGLQALLPSRLATGQAPDRDGMDAEERVSARGEAGLQRRGQASQSLRLLWRLSLSPSCAASEAHDASPSSPAQVYSSPKEQGSHVTCRTFQSSKEKAVKTREFDQVEDRVTRIARADISVHVDSISLQMWQSVNRLAVA